MTFENNIKRSTGYRAQWARNLIRDGDMNSNTVESLHAHFEQLLGYLHSDPQNLKLWKDCFDLGLRLSRFDDLRRLLQGVPSELPDGERANVSAVVELAEGNSQQAYELLAPWVADPEAPLEWLHNAAYACIAAGRHDQVEQMLGARVDLLESGECTSLYLLNLMQQSRTGDAIDLGQRYWQAGGRSGKALSFYALALSDHGQFRDAAQMATAALQQGADANAYTALGFCSLGAGSGEEAVGYFSRALQRVPSNGRAWLGLALAMLIEGRLEDAKEAGGQAASYNPDHPGSWHVLGWAQLLSNELEDAEASFMSALAADRNFSETHGALAVVQHLRGKTEEATHARQIALRLDPQSRTGRFALALEERARGADESARELLERIYSTTTMGTETLLQAVMRLSKGGR